MVFVNNTVDTLVNGHIYLSDLVPDCMCNTILNVFRKKFLCEFIPDEVKRTIDVVFFRDLINEKSEIDLTKSLTSDIEFNAPTYQKIGLTSENSISDGDSFDSTMQLKDKYPAAYVDKGTGGYFRIGYNDIGRMNQKIATSTIPYLSEGDQKEKKVECPDALFSVIGNEGVASIGFLRPIYIPYIGDGQTLNSSLIVHASNDEDDDKESSDTNEKASNKDQSPMLALTYISIDNYCLGTNTNYTMFNEKFTDYSLLYNGPDGIFEKFYREYDNLLRNSLHPIRCNLLLSDHDKMNIPSHKKIIINGQDLFIDKLKYQIGGNNEPAESSFFTVRMYEPINVAKSEGSRFPSFPDRREMGCWKVEKEDTEITVAEYESALIKYGEVSSFRSSMLPIIYPPFPTKEQVASGKTYYERSAVFFKKMIIGNVFTKTIYYKRTSKLRPIKTID